MQSASKCHTKMLGAWIDSPAFKSDILSVTGAQMKEQAEMSSHKYFCGNKSTQLAKS
jgi:hypothetical protein